MRTAKISRKTKETEIEVNLSLDGGEIEIDTGKDNYDTREIQLDYKIWYKLVD